MGITTTAARIAPLVLSCLCVAGAVATPAPANAADPTPAQSPLGTGAAPAAPEPAAATTTPMDPAAKDHYDRGLRLYADRDFASAVGELEIGYGIDPRREFLFAQAQALRLAGACERAIPLYRRFLDTHPSGIQVEAARLGLDRCGPERSPAGAPITTAPAGVTAPRPPPVLPLSPAPPAPTTAHPPWWRDTWAALAVGAGVAGLGTAVAFEVASRQARDEASSPATRTYQASDRSWGTAQRRRVIALSAAAAGAALIAAGGTRWFILRRQAHADGGRTAAAGAVFNPVAGGGIVGWEGSF